MSKPNDQAYPVSSNQYAMGWEGLTKRELIAAMAMQGLIGKIQGHVDGVGDPENHARHAVVYADALLAELAKAEAQ